MSKVSWASLEISRLIEVGTINEFMHLKIVKAELHLSR
jgi:hypothetical protein